MANPSLQIGNSKWAIKEDNLLGYSTAGTRFLPIPITMTRASAGTRVNPQGLVETVELLGSEEVTDGNFPTPNTDWSFIGTTEISGGTANFPDSTNSFLIQNFVVDLSIKTYKIVYEVVTTNGQNFRLAGGNSAFGVLTLDSATVGLKTKYITSNGTKQSLQFNNNSFVGSIDNVSVKESTRNDLARVDYTGSTSSLLAEPQRTNLITYSEEVGSLTNSTLTNTISPDGTLNGLKINETTSNSQHYGTSYAASVVSGTIYTVSFYIKKGTYDLVKVYTQSSRISAQIIITFSTESTSASGSDFIVGSNFMEDAGNGWYRVGFSATPNTTGAVSIYLSIKDLSSYVGDVSQYTEYWGTQIEQGSYATSYIPTDGEAGGVTRVQDQYSKTGISDKIGAEGVLFIEMAALSNDGTNRVISLNDGTSTNRLMLYFNSSSNTISVAGIGGTIIYTVSDETSFNKMAVRYKANDITLWVDGESRGTPIESATIPTFTALKFDSGSAASPFFGKVKQLQIYDTYLSNGDMQTLTT